MAVVLSVTRAPTGGGQDLTALEQSVTTLQSDLGIERLRTDALYPAYKGTPSLTEGEIDGVVPDRAALGEYGMWLWRAIVRTGPYVGQVSTAEVLATLVAGAVEVHPVGTSSVIEWFINPFTNRLSVRNNAVETCQIEYWGIRLQTEVPAP